MELTTRSPTDRIVDAIADEAGVDPVELTPPLADAVDPDALDALLNAPVPTPGSRSASSIGSTKSSPGRTAAWT